MKKFISLWMAVVLSMCYSFATTIYCQMTQDWWTDANAAIAVHYWGGTSASTTWPGVRMTPVQGKTGTWSYDVPADVDGLMFVRVNGSGAIEYWGAKTTNLTLSTDGKNLYIITSINATWDDPGCSGKWSTYDAEAEEETIVSSVPSQATDVMLQAFYWDSYPGGSGNAYGNTGWSTLLAQSEELGTYFDLIWFPPASYSSGGTGYIPKQYSNLNSDWGTAEQLNALISALHNSGTKVVADIVINHCGNYYNSCDFYPLDFGTHGSFQPDNTWITTNDEGGCSGGSHADVGYDGEENYPSARDWDHQNANVQAMCRAYLKWMKDQGFDGWRYDYGKGFTHNHINDYNTAAGAYFSVVEYWDGNRDVLQTRLNEADWNTMVFDFSTKYNALNDGICANNYSKCQGAGLPGVGKSKYAVTFVDNHDTFQRNSSEFGGQNNSMTDGLKDRLLQANAYILSMPGIPCVFYPHWVTYKEEIKKMIEARHITGVHSESEVRDEYYDQNGYQATIVGKNGYIVLQLGNRATGTINGFTKHASGNGYAIWVYTNSQEEDPETPSGNCQDGPYGLIINSTDTVNATSLAETDYQGRKQYMVDSVLLEIGDELVVANLSCTAKWTIAIETGGASSSFERSEDKYTVTKAGTYTFYIKMSMDLGDLMYISELNTSEPGEPTVDPVDSVTMYFVNVPAWNLVNAFVWLEGTGTYKDWPGEAMSKLESKINEKDVYAYTFPATFTSIIFNNGGSNDDNQTADLAWNTAKPYFYNGEWYERDSIPTSDEPGDEPEECNGKYGILLNNAFVPAAKNEAQTEWLEYAIEGIELAEGDMFQLYDSCNAAAWIVNAAYQNEAYAFNVVEEKWVVTVAGTYDLYIKLIPNADELYVIKQDYTAPQDSTITDGYYLVGTLNNWEPTVEYKFAQQIGDPAMRLTTALDVGDEFKVVSVWNGQIESWYPVGDDSNNYVVTENFAGAAKNIFFRSDYLGQSYWHHNCIFVEPNQWTYDIYLNTGGTSLWGADNPTFLCHPSLSLNYTEAMTHVSGNIYKVAINIFNIYVIFERVDPVTGYTWNQTAELAIPEGMNLYTITGWGENDGYWSVYGNNPATDIDNNAVKAETIKVLRDGHMFIIKGDKIYNVVGLEVK